MVPAPLPHLGQDGRREREPTFISMEGHDTLPCLWTAAWLVAPPHLEVPLIQLRGSTCQAALRAWTQKPRARLGVNEPCAHCSAAVLAGPAVLCPPWRGNGTQQQGREDKQSCPFLPSPWAGGQFFPLSSCRDAACRIPPLPEPPPCSPPSLLASFIYSISKDCSVCVPWLGSVWLSSSGGLRVYRRRDCKSSRQTAPGQTRPTHCL